MSDATASLTATLPDIRANAGAFASNWAGERRERAEKDTFWNEFFEIFGINRRRVGAVFEYVARRYSTSRHGFVDLLWPGYIGVEHKSAGEDIEAAMDQLVDYLPSVANSDLPRLLVVCDFDRFVVRDTETGTETRFDLAELPHRIELFAFLAGYSRNTEYVDEEQANLVATDHLARLYDGLSTINYPVHETRVLLVRLLYLLFGDDTGVWAHRLFEDYLTVKTNPDGTDLGLHLNDLFDLLNTPPGQRMSNLDPTMAEFPYVNGGVFAERLRSWRGTPDMRAALLDACRFEWSRISPVIFGSLFQNVMEPAERRQLGAHFTSERDIMRVIRPLFLDELEAELAAAKSATIARLRRLREFHDKLAQLTFLDPACGVGNFLLLTFRELRRLEQDVLLAIREADPNQHATTQVLDIDQLVKVTPGQFFGIEIEEFPARIAETAMHLVDHIANVELGAAFGTYFVRLPIAQTATICVDDALKTDWHQVLAAGNCSYLLGKPPFVGIALRSADQTAALQDVWGSGYHGTLDFVTGWYKKAYEYIGDGTTRAALVSTNSITQGEQVAPLWDPLIAAGFQIDFAHQTFAWVSEARGRAHVHVVIIGFSYGGQAPRETLFEYENISAEPVAREVKSINPYLVDAPLAPVHPRSNPFSALVPDVAYGNKPTDDGNLIIEPEDIDAFRADPVAAKYLRRFIGARELLHNTPRWCLWLKDLQPGDLGRSALLRQRVDAVKRFRDASRAAATRDYGQPALFRQIAQPSTEYLGIPIHVSESREYFIAGYYGAEVIASNANFIAPDPTGLAFAVISSAMFIVWQKAVGGRIKSDLRFNKLLTWNTFPLTALTDQQCTDLAVAGRKVVDARAQYPDSSLAELYEPNGIPQPLRTAHRDLDRIMDRVIGGRSRIRNDRDRVRVLFERYAAAVNDGQLIPAAAPAERTRRGS